MRLLEKAKEIGIVYKEKIKYLEEARETIKLEVERINEISISMKEANKVLESVNSKDRFGKGVKLSELLKQKEVTYDSLKSIIEIRELPEFVKNQIETIIKYNSFIQREKLQIEKFKKLEALKIPKEFNFSEIVGLSNIAKDGLEEIKPLSIGEATRISGVTGNDIAILITHLEKKK
jgi:tRNA uridine 5-carboxymethylaminomethyl modification enzyme